MEFYLIDDFSTHTHYTEKEKKPKIEYLCEKCFIVFSADIRRFFCPHPVATH